MIFSDNTAEFVGPTGVEYHRCAYHPLGKKTCKSRKENMTASNRKPSFIAFVSTSSVISLKKINAHVK